ncbi:hypothetical protein [Streptomyces sp. NPDC056938]|uniref:hypothetical protein n=1 Tax=unclassified Streptomyces TaxID=2593676 RepID=UPI00362B6180
MGDTPDVQPRSRAYCEISPADETQTVPVPSPSPSRAAAAVDDRDTACRHAAAETARREAAERERDRMQGERDPAVNSARGADERRGIADAAPGRRRPG